MYSAINSGGSNSNIKLDGKPLKQDLYLTDGYNSDTRLALNLIGIECSESSEETYAGLCFFNDNIYRIGNKFDESADLKRKIYRLEGDIWVDSKIQAPAQSYKPTSAFDTYKYYTYNLKHNNKYYLFSRLGDNMLDVFDGTSIQNVTTVPLDKSYDFTRAIATINNGIFHVMREYQYFKYDIEQNKWTNGNIDMPTSIDGQNSRLINVYDDVYLFISNREFYKVTDSGLESKGSLSGKYFDKKKVWESRDYAFWYNGSSGGLSLFNKKTLQIQASVTIWNFDSDVSRVYSYPEYNLFGLDYINSGYGHTYDMWMLDSNCIELSIGR